MLFSKGKVPRKMWRIQMEKFIRERRDEFIQECEKYGDATAKLIEAV